MNLIALDIGGTAIKSALFTKEQLIFSHECPSEAKLGGNKVFENICRIIDDVMIHHSLDAIGISTAGQVDSDQGVILYANENIPGYTGMELKKRLEDRYRIPAYIENDVNAAALGEANYGSGKNEKDFLCLTYGTGIGGAIIMNHQLYKGSLGIAAEMGHMVTHPNGLTCGCGGHGCYEQYASTTALIKTAIQVNPSFSNGKKLFDAFLENDTVAKKIIDTWIDEISYGLINLIYIFNPSCIVLGGGIMVQPYICQQIKDIIARNTMESFHNVKIASAALGNLAGVYGMLSIAKIKMVTKS